ncbi:hypothetical protein OSB04_029050 [Centaurea solstitialis]|uniref:DUF7866 domain-containing protein n=1 Tax=Centaurea solstitialis TaxID=347529 RepID=A0AA38SII6_9ASTR|nr:hypothetical protein OSB04_029050 [Centaurea solstitialis]
MSSASAPSLSAASRILLFFFLLLLNPIPFLHANQSMADESMVPLIGKGEMLELVLNDTRRKLGGFQICSLCTCCNSGNGGGGGGGGGKYCLPSPCCYAINCNIPNRPFGFCSFTPKTCNCFGCHL